MTNLNESGINPVEYNVLVLPSEVETQTKGGLLLADSTVEKEQFGRMEGTLTAVSPMAFTFLDWPAHEEDKKPKVGDTVMFSKYAASEITGKDGKTYWVMKDKSIVGVMK